MTRTRHSVTSREPALDDSQCTLGRTLGLVQRWRVFWQVAAVKAVVRNVTGLDRGIAMFVTRANHRQNTNAIPRI
jgi:hypothetical protein